MMDFNDAIPAPSANEDSRREEIRASLLSKLESVLTMMFPAGKVKRGKVIRKHQTCLFIIHKRKMFNALQRETQRKGI